MKAIVIKIVFKYCLRYQNKTYATVCRSHGPCILYCSISCILCMYYICICGRVCVCKRETTRKRHIFLLFFFFKKTRYLCIRAVTHLLCVPRVRIRVYTQIIHNNLLHFFPLNLSKSKMYMYSNEWTPLYTCTSRYRTLWYVMCCTRIQNN